jgi:hypothetical protein
VKKNVLFFSVKKNVLFLYEENNKKMQQEEEGNVFDLLPTEVGRFFVVEFDKFFF